MPFENYRDPIIPVSPAGLTRAELQRYLNVGRNNVTPITLRFGIECIHGLYPEAVIWRQLFGVEPADDAARDHLREQLADINWVAWMTGVPCSTVRNAVSNASWHYDIGVQLGADRASAAPRLRRWLPTLIRCRALGDMPPSLIPVTPIGERDSLGAATSDDPLQEGSDNIFAALLQASADYREDTQNNKSR